jgi:uncharacterized protein YfdQ (DUF2303 family)
MPENDTPGELLASYAGTLRSPDTRHIEELVERAAAVDAIAREEQDTDVKVAILPDGHRLVVVDQERFAPEPVRRRGVASVTEIAPFGGYVTAHHGEGTTVWISHDPDNLGETSLAIGDIVAVIDDHRPGAAGWGEHRVDLPIRTTPQWQHWLSRDGDLLPQVAFSDHLRQGLNEIIEPDAATILEVAQDLVVSTQATLGSVVREGGDLKVSFTAEATARAGSKTVESEIPEVFTLRVAPFAGAMSVEIEARLKWRDKGGVLHLGYTLVRPLEALRDAIDALEVQLKDELPPSVRDRVYRGKPIAPAARNAVHVPAETTR